MLKNLHPLSIVDHHRAAVVTPGTADTPLSRKRRWLILAVCSLSVLIVQIDATGMNLALPSIARQMEASTGQLQWIIDAYLVVLASLLMFSGALADRVGRRKVLMFGLVIFGVGSLLCSLATDPLMLIGMRAVQAVGGSMLAPVALSVIANTFTNPKERASAIGIWGAVVGIGAALGPLVGGALVHLIDWRAVFWINLPIVALALPLVLKVVPESRAPDSGPIDVKGQVLGIILLASLTFFIIDAGERGFGAPEAIIAGVVALIALPWFLRTEKRASNPMLQLRYFRSMPFALANLIAVLVYFAFAGFTFVSTLYLQDGRGLNALHAGLALLPMALVSGTLAPVSGWMVGKWGERPPMLIAAALMTGSALMLLQMDAQSPLLWFIAASVLMASSLALVNAPITNVAVSGMPLTHAGVAGATASTARQLGQALGVAVLGAMLNAGLQGKQAFTVAAHPGWWLVLVSAVAIALLALLAGSARAKASQAKVNTTFAHD